MSLSPIKIWRNIDSDKYVPGMDLGPPDEIVNPESLVRKGSIQPIIISEERTKSIAKSASKRKKFKLTRDEFLKFRLAGVSRSEIVERNDISVITLRQYLTAWGIGKPEQEIAALEAFVHEQQA